MDTGWVNLLLPLMKGTVVVDDVVVAVAVMMAVMMVVVVVVVVKENDDEVYDEGNYHPQSRLLQFPHYSSSPP